MGVRPVDVRRVGDDHRKARCIRERRKPAAVAHLDGQPQGGAVGAGQRGRGRHPVHRPYIGIRSLRLERKGDGTGARAQIQQGAGAARQAGQRLFHQHLGIGARDQGGRAHFQRQRPELPLTDEVGNGLTIEATGKPARQGRLLGGIELVLRPGHQIAAPTIQQMTEQGIGVGTGGFPGGQGRHDMGAGLLDLHQLLSAREAS